MRALDFYSGVGGWTVGLRLAGIEVVKSYEWWQPALHTNNVNNKHANEICDVRSINLADLPHDIDVIVGSPPCTQFSFSNRGGKGDIDDGFCDVRKFLQIVDHCKPKYWVMENVPRLGALFRDETSASGRLAEFSGLEYNVVVVDGEEFGLPQRRKRCFIGNLDFERLLSYRSRISRLSLGEVVYSLASNPPIDPNYGITLPSHSLTDNEMEEPLSDEEVRLNEAAKKLHPIYNFMAFPDPMDRSARTITATCTRVSRESIVIAHPPARGFRRLTIRERATLQGFPITYQFYGRNFSEKEKLVGNAMPPIFAYYLSNCILGVEAEDVRLPTEAVSMLPLAPAPSPATLTSRAGRVYPVRRRFKFSIPALHLKSGVRFELANHFYDEKVEWRVDFYFGPSKKVQRIRLNHKLFTDAVNPRLFIECSSEATVELLRKYLVTVDWGRLQEVWSHKGPGGTRPLDLLDEISNFASRLSEQFAVREELMLAALKAALESSFPASVPVNVDKLFRHAPVIVAGFVVGCMLNLSANSKNYFELNHSRNRAQGT